MNMLTVGGAPHIHTQESVNRIMWVVTASLIPAGLAGVFFFGAKALAVILLGIFSAAAAEAGLQLIAKKKVSILDGSAVLTGLLLAYNLSPDAPFWLVICGSFFAIAIGKQIFGGLGQNIFNPALAGRAFLMASWPRQMTTFSPTAKSLEWGFRHPFSFDAVTSATPLSFIKEGHTPDRISHLFLFLGNKKGCIGEVCIWALLLGGLFLLLKGYISWHIPVTFIAAVGLFSWILGPGGLFTGDWLFQIFTGGLILGAFFMATDYVTSPLTRQGQLIFGFGCGVLTAIIRRWGGYPEGASYAILMMNAATPLIDRYTRNRTYGTVR